MRTILQYLILGLIFTSCTDKRSRENIIDDIELAFSKNDTIAANREIVALSKKDGESALSFYYNGLLDKNLKHHESALINFQKAIELDSTHYKALVERAKLKIELGDLNSAIEDCNRARLINKIYFPIYKTKGIAFQILEDGENAIIQYQTAIEFGDNSGETYYKLGVLQLSYGQTKKGCSNLSKAGELGFMDAFDLIKSNCNIQNLKGTESSNNEIKNKNVIGQFKSYPGRFAITFPRDWKVDEISNSDKSMLHISAQKEGHFMQIIEIDPTVLDPSMKAKSVWEIDKDEFLAEYRNKYDDFKLITDDKKIINGVQAYSFKLSFSYFSDKFQKRLAGIHVQYIVMNPRTKKIYYLMGNAEEDDIEVYELIYRKTFETFKLI